MVLALFSQGGGGGGDVPRRTDPLEGVVRRDEPQLSPLHQAFPNSGTPNLMVSGAAKPLPVVRFLSIAWHIADCREMHGNGPLASYAPPPLRYGIQMRVHDRYCSAQSRGAKQKSKKQALHPPQHWGAQPPSNADSATRKRSPKDAVSTPLCTSTQTCPFHHNSAVPQGDSF